MKKKRIVLFICFFAFTLIAISGTNIQTYASQEHAESHEGEAKDVEHRAEAKEKAAQEHHDEHKDKADATFEDVKKETGEAVETITTYTQKKRNESQKKLETKLQEYDKKIEELAIKARGLKEEAKAQFNHEMAELKKKKEDVAKRLEEIRDVGEKAWVDLKKEMDESIDALDKSFKKALSRFN